MEHTVRAERIDDTTRWVTIRLSLRNRADGERPVVYSAPFALSITAMDSEAARYTLDVWESGIVSAVSYIWRRAVISGVTVHSLNGQLSAEDVEGVAYAATVALIHAVAGNIPIPANQAWVIKEA